MQAGVSVAILEFDLAMHLNGLLLLLPLVGIRAWYNVVVIHLPLGSSCPIPPVPPLV